MTEHGAADDSGLSLDFHTVELEQNDREELERYKKIVDRLLSARKGRVVSFYLEEKHPGSFRITVTAPKMDEKKIAEYISATLDIMKVSLLAHADTDQLMDSMKLSLERYEANKMTIDLTPEELETIIKALQEAYSEYMDRADVWRGRERDGFYRDAAERCAALSKRLGELAKEVGR